MVTPQAKFQHKFPDFYSILRCETYAILQALKFIDASKESNFIILSDSMSAIEEIENTSKIDYITQELQEYFYKLKTN